MKDFLLAWACLAAVAVPVDQWALRCRRTGRLGEESRTQALADAAQLGGARGLILLSAAASAFVPPLALAACAWAYARSRRSRRPALPGGGPARAVAEEPGGPGPLAVLLERLTMQFRAPWHATVLQLAVYAVAAGAGLRLLSPIPVPAAAVPSPRSLAHAGSPQVILCQQVPGGKPDEVYRDLQSAVREAGMTAVTVRRGYPGPAVGPDCHTASVVRSGACLDVDSAGPAGVPWSEALLAVAGIPCPVRFYSTWLAGTSKAWQGQYARQLAGRVTGLARARGELAFAGGNWNCLAPADNYTQPQLRKVPERLHLAAIDMWWDDTLEPVLDVHIVLEDAGLADVAAIVPLRHRYPPDLRPTGRGGRTCRAYATRDLARAVGSYRQVPSDAGDDLLVMTIDPGAASLSLQGSRT